MKKYFVNKKNQTNGDHEVHHEDCIYLPHIDNRIYLGEFPACSGAVVAARKIFLITNGCRTCSWQCHTG